MLDGDKKKFIAITLNFYIVVNKNYLYNYSENIKKVTNACLINNLETIERNRTKENKCIIKGIIR